MITNSPKLWENNFCQWTSLNFIHVFCIQMVFSKFWRIGKVSSSIPCGQSNASNYQAYRHILKLILKELKLLIVDSPPEICLINISVRKHIRKQKQQECIPVGCVPPAAIDVFPATYAPHATHAPLPHMPHCHACSCHTHLPAMHAPTTHVPPPWTPWPCTSSLPHMPPMDRILDTHLWTYYLAATLLRAVYVRKWVCNTSVSVFVTHMFPKKIYNIHMRDHFNNSNSKIRTIINIMYMSPEWFFLNKLITQYMSVLLIGNVAISIEFDFRVCFTSNLWWHLRKMFPPVSEERFSYQTYKQTTHFHSSCLFYCRNRTIPKVSSHLICWD